MIYLKKVDLASSMDGLIVKRPNVVLVDDEDVYYVTDARFDEGTEDEVTFKVDDDGNITQEYLKAVITCTAATTLDVWFTEAEYNAGTPSTTLSLNVGDNTVYFNHAIFRIGVVTYNPSTLRRTAINSNITRIALDGKWESGCRMFDNSLLVEADLTYLDTSSMKTFFCLFQGCKYITYVGDLTKFNTSKVTDMRSLFNSCSGLTEIGDISRWDISSVTAVTYMFQNCAGLRKVGNLSKWDISNLTDISYMFPWCYSLETLGDISKWDVSHVTNMQQAFCYCTKITDFGDLSKWDVSNVTNFQCAFYACKNLKYLGNLKLWNISNATNIAAIFCMCYNLAYVGDISGWNFSKCQSLGSLFKHCFILAQELDVSSWNVSNVTDLEMTFDTCCKLNLKGFKNWDVSNVTNMHGTFRKCVAIDPEEFDFSTWDTSKVTNMSQMFANQESGDRPGEGGDEEYWIESGYFPTNMTELSITRIKCMPMIPAGCAATTMFKYCDKFTTIDSARTISASVSFEDSPLTRASALVVLNALDSSNVGTITFSKTTYALLSTDDISIGTNKGWSIASAA